VERLKNHDSLLFGVVEVSSQLPHHFIQIYDKAELKALNESYFAGKN
jgi:hypothetical protein